LRTRLVIIGVVILGGILRWRAWGAPESPIANVRLDVQMVSVSVADSLSLVPALREARTAAAGWDRLQGMVASGQAELIDWPVVWSRVAIAEKRDREAGEAKPVSDPAERDRSVSENIEELRYPSEFDPPTEPQTFGMVVEPKKLVRPGWEKFLPNAYETRNTGPSLEARACVEDEGRILSINLVAQHVHLLRFDRWQKQAAPLGIAGIGVEPEFITSKVTTSLRVRAGQPTLVHVCVIPNPQPHVELFVLHARVTLLPPEAMTPPIPPSLSPYLSPPPVPEIPPPSTPVK